MYGHGRLLKEYIESMEESPVERAEEGDVEMERRRNLNSLIHELIRNNHLKAVYAVKELASEVQWEYLTGVRSYA